MQSIEIFVSRKKIAIAISFYYLLVEHQKSLRSFLHRSGSTPTDSKSASSSTVCPSPPLSLPPRSCSCRATSATASRYLHCSRSRREHRRRLWQTINQAALRKLPEEPTDISSMSISPSVRQPLRRSFTLRPMSAFPHVTFVTSVSGTCSKL